MLDDAPMVHALDGLPIIAAAAVIEPYKCTCILIGLKCLNCVCLPDNNFADSNLKFEYDLLD